jgi:hypothetical protein
MEFLKFSLESDLDLAGTKSRADAQQTRRQTLGQDHTVNRKVRFNGIQLPCP